LTNGQVSTLTKEYPSASYVCPVFPGVLHVREGQNIKLFLASAPSRINGKQDWVGNTATNKARYDCKFEETQEEIGVKAVVAQDVGIWDLP
jgi:hypothetical protein